MSFREGRYRTAFDIPIIARQLVTPLMPISWTVMPERHKAVRPRKAVRARMISAPGFRIAALGRLAENMPRYASEPIEFRHRACLGLGERHLNVIEAGDSQIAYVWPVIKAGYPLGEDGVSQP